MKKAAAWGMAIALAIFVVDWGVMGVKIFTNDFDIMTEAWIGAVCLAVCLACAVGRLLGSKCPHCGKLRLTGGAYCAQCGKRIE